MTDRNRIRPCHGWLGLFCCLLITVLTTKLAACPFCPGASVPLTEKLTHAPTACLVRWVEGDTGTIEKPGHTVFKVLKVIKQSQSTQYEKGSLITVNHYHFSKPGGPFLLTGTHGPKPLWENPTAITPASYAYVMQAPSLQKPTTERLQYFLKFLEHQDMIIANDAFAEFANAPFEDIVPLTPQLPREKLHHWLSSKSTPAPRLGLYGLMLGLCGNEDDIDFMEDKINVQAQGLRSGIGGLMSGYLMLTGSEGLDHLERSKFQQKNTSPNELFAAREAVSFMWTYGKGRYQIPPERLRQSMRMLLNRPELADLVIADLARWQDWTVMDRLVSLYDAEGYDYKGIRQAIIRYLLVASRYSDPSDGGPDATTAARARKYLTLIRNRDPQLVKRAERFY